MPEAPVRGRAGGALRFWLFGLYLAVYLAFVILTAFDREAMAASPYRVNVAVLFGFGLIGAAIVLALLYWWLCRDDGAAAPGTSAETGR